MKILLISNLYEPYVIGGAERIAQSIAEAMVSRGHTVTVVTLAPRNAAERRRIKGVDVRAIPVRNAYHPYTKSPSRPVRLIWHVLDTFNFAAARDIGRIIDEDRPDVVHTHNIAGFSSAVWWTVGRRRIPSVHTMQDYYLLCSRSMLFSNGCNCERICNVCAILSAVRRRIVSRLTAIVAVSNFVLSAHERRIDTFRSLSPKRTIHNGVSHFGEDAKEPIEVRRESIRIGFLGQLVECKGVARLLEDFKGLSQPNVEILVGGNGPDRFVQDLHTRYSTDRRIQFLGHVRASDFLGSIDLLAVPSLWNDPCPLVVAEAILNGVPVIGSRRGGIPELIREGVDGLLFEPTVAGEFAAAFRRAIECGLVATKKPQMPRWSTDHLTIQTMSDKYESLYREIV